MAANWLLCGLVLVCMVVTRAHLDVCPQVNLFVVLDTGMYADQLAPAVKSIQRLIQMMPLSEGGMRMALMTNGENLNGIQPLTSNKKQLLSKLPEIRSSVRGDLSKSLPQITAATSTGGQNTRRVLIYYSDGLFPHPNLVYRNAVKLRQANVTVLGVVMGTASSSSQMAELVSDPVSDHLMIAETDYYCSEALPVQILLKLLTKICVCPKGTRLIMDECQPIEPTCDGQSLEVIYLVDTSISISPEQLDTFNRFIVDLSARFRIEPRSQKVAMLALGPNEVNVLANLDTVTDTKALAAVLSKVRFSNEGSTPIEKGLAAARDHIFTRTGRRILIMFTDGSFRSPALGKETAMNMTKDGTSIYVVGFKRAIQRKLQDVSSYAQSRIYMIEKDTPDLNQHLAMVDEMATNICANEESTLNDEASTSDDGTASATDKPTQPATESPIQPTTEWLIQPTKERPIQPTTEWLTHPTTETPTQHTSEWINQPTTEKPTQPATEKPTQPATEKPTQPATEKPTQSGTRTPTQAATRTPTKAATRTPTQPATKKPTQAATRTPTQAATRTPTQAATERQRPTQTLTERPTQPVTRKPTQPATRTPTQSATRTSTQSATRKPTQPATRTPTQPATRKPTQSATRTPTQSATRTPTQSATRTPTQPATRTPTQPATRRPTYEPTYSTDRTVTACEHESLTLSCPAGIISIKYASYGRHDLTTCSLDQRGQARPIQTSICRASSSLEILQADCDGKSKCTVAASNAKFSDPCYGTFKYLQVIYSCAAAALFDVVSQVCEHDQMRLSCETGSHIQIIGASYGRADRWTCFRNGLVRDTDCDSTLSLSKVREICENKEDCRLLAGNSVFADPCVGTFKYLTVKHRCSRTTGDGGTGNEKSTQLPTQRPTQPPTQRHTQPPTQSPTQPPTERPSQSPTQRPTQPPTERPTQPPTQRPTQPPTQRPTQPPTQRPTQPPTQRPTQPPTQRPTQRATQPPTQRPTQPPTQRPTQSAIWKPTIEPTYSSITQSPREDFCSSRRDVIVLIETRMAFSDAQLNLMEKIAEKLASLLPVGPDKVRVGYAEYSEITNYPTVRELINLNKAKSTVELVTRIRRMLFNVGLGAMLDDALRYAGQVFSKTDKSVPKVVVMITGGYASRPGATREQVLRLKRDFDTTLIGVVLKDNVEETDAKYFNNLLSGVRSGATNQNTVVFSPPKNKELALLYEDDFYRNLQRKVCGLPLNSLQPISPQ